MSLGRRLGGLVRKVGSSVARGASSAASKVRESRDPSRDPGFISAARQVEAQIKATKHDFNWDEMMVILGATKSEQVPLARLVYQRAVKRVWSDTVVTDTERRYLSWLKDRIPLNSADEVAVRLSVERAVFNHVLSEVLHDGVVSQDELKRLKRLADDIGEGIADLARQFLGDGGVLFLDQSMEKLIHQRNGGLEAMKEEWDHIKAATKALGLSATEVTKLIRPAAERLLEHVIIDAKADNKLWPHEETAIKWVLSAFALPTEFRRYAESQMETLRAMGELLSGKMPSLPHSSVPNFEFHPVEIVHLHLRRCCVAQSRMLKAGPKTDEWQGCFVLTNLRLLFLDDDGFKEFKQKLKSLTNVSFRNGEMTFTKGTSRSTFDFGPECELEMLLLRRAIDLAKGRRVAGFEETGDVLPTRHISREVRQRVWAEYGGQCADCNATQYLEFDHIIPHSRGGTNDLQNIQLLCRGCNLKKSNSI